MIDPTAADTAVAIVITVPLMTIRAILLAVGPGVAGVRTGPLEIGLGVSLGLTPADVLLGSTLITVTLGAGRLGILFLPHLLLWVQLLLRLNPLLIDFLSFCPALSTPHSPLVRLSCLHVPLLVFILREEYFQTPPGGPSPVRSIATSLLQGLWTHQEATGVAITPALHNPTVIIPTLHDPAGVTMITI